LFDTLNSIYGTYLSCSPLGEMKKIPALLPPSLSEPLKYITKCSGTLAGATIWFSHYSTMKSTSACDLMVVRGLKSMLRAPSSTAQFGNTFSGILIVKYIRQ
jgi:hypothetical protein